jgi:hypothetical protein
VLQYVHHRSLILSCDAVSHHLCNPMELNASSTRPHITCNVCKLRKKRCDGVKPSCSYCFSRSLQCIYSRTPTHKLSRSAIQPKSEGEARPPQHRSQEKITRSSQSTASLKRPELLGNNSCIEEVRGHPHLIDYLDFGACC